MKIGIVGYGVVGRALEQVFSITKQNRICVYDKFVAPHETPGSQAAIQECDIVFVAVPTPSTADGFSCDASAVEEACLWITAPVCVKSTVPPGTICRLAAKIGRPIGFSPEYVGESPWHPWKNIESHGFVIVGGPQEVTRLVVQAYQGCLGPDVRYYVTDATTAEVCKYMENCYLATKVAFVNQFYDIAEAFGVDYHELRELWLADPRIGRSHSIVTQERGFRGRCLPKDLRAMVSAMKPLGGAPLLEAVLYYNTQVCAKADAAGEAKHSAARSGLDIAASRSARRPQPSHPKGGQTKKLRAQTD